jgi:hypothetical protein
LSAAAIAINGDGTRSCNGNGDVITTPTLWIWCDVTDSNSQATSNTSHGWIYQIASWLNENTAAAAEAPFVAAAEGGPNPVLEGMGNIRISEIRTKAFFGTV